MILNQPGALACRFVLNAPGWRENEIRPCSPVPYRFANSCACITFIALLWPYFRPWPRKPDEEAKLMSAQFTPSGVGEARWPDEETNITRVAERGVEGRAAVERHRGVRKCWRRKGARTLTPSWTWWPCAVVVLSAGIITPAL